jgi:macrolide transport system ATP-binding/permease protein
MIRDLWQDLQFGVRMFRKNRGFTLVAILTLALGIGANAAVYSWIEGILFRPFPAVTQQDRLLAVAGTARGTSGFDDVSWPDFVDFQRSCTLIDSFIANKITGTTLSIGDRAERATGSIVSANYFQALGVRPILGRGFEPTDDSGRNAHPVTVISYRVWQERFAADPGIIGKTQRLNGVPFTIVGVGPEGFYGTFVGYAIQFWVPASMQETFDASGYKLEDRGARWIEGFVKLKPGVTREQAQDQISAVAKRLETDYPATNRGRGVQLFELWNHPFDKASEILPTLRILLVVVILVLLIACANVGNLMLVRSFARRQELAVRLAVGASRRRLLRQLLTEGLILSGIAAAGGLLIAYWCRHGLVPLFPAQPGVEVNLAGAIDWRVLGLSIGVGVFSTLLFALVPALQSGKIDLVTTLKSESRGGVGSSQRSWIRSSLVLVQVSLSFILLVGAGLLFQSLRQIRSASPGFATENMLTTGVNLLAAGYDTQRAKIFQDALIERVKGISGVESAVYSRTRPFSYFPFSSAPIAVDGYESQPNEQPTVEYNEVGPGYLAATGIPLLAGREFTDADNETAPLVAVINETMAAEYWRGENPIGKRVQLNGRWMQVIGVARVSKYRTFMETPKPFCYVPLRQNFSRVVSLNLRTRLDPGAMAAALVREVHALDPELAPSELITMREHIDRSTYSQKIAVMLLGVFGGLALLLAAIGLYGVMSYAVSQSTRELGLRMAIGARPLDLFRLVMSRGLTLTAGGIVLGAAAALGLTRLIGDLLYEVNPRDPLAFGSAFLVMTIVALAACLLPAWRTTRIDPVRALRE